MQIHDNNNHQPLVRAITATTNLSSLYENPTDNKPANLDLSKFMSNDKNEGLASELDIINEAMK
jgi:ubiquitin-protein ligase